MAEVRLESLTRTFPGSAAPAVDQLSLHVPDGSLTVILGDEGSGKSTALRMLAGLEEVDSGRVHLGGLDITRLPPTDRGVVMVFENYALYPHMTVAANIGFPMRVEGVAAAEIDIRVREVAEVLEMSDRLEERPANISGIERHLVALGRALVRRPRVLLMDDPLDNLTQKARAQTSDHLRELQQRLRVTTVYATSHAAEALAMADRLAVMHRGRVVQVGTPAQVLEHPADEQVARLLDGQQLPEGQHRA